MSSLISVILPVYNAEKYVKEAIQSILNQTYPHFELLVINDGSIDNSLQIINSFEDNRIVLINNPENLGLIDTLDIGIRKSKGDYIARMDADDISLPQRFEKQIEFLNLNPDIDILGTSFEIFGHENKISNTISKSKQIEIELYFNNVICHPSVMMRADSIMKNNLFFEKQYIHNEDWAFWLSAIQKGLKISNLNIVLLKYRLEGQNISINNSSTAFERHGDLYAHFIKDLFKESSIKMIQLHQTISRPATVLYKNSIINLYFDKLKVSFLKKGYSNYDIDTVFNKMKMKLFYKIADLNKLNAFQFIIQNKLFNFKYLRYLLPSFK